MGMITIETKGSFRRLGQKSFSALKHGHARALTDAIRYLADQLPEAIRQDHNLHEEGHLPEQNFGED